MSNHFNAVLLVRFMWAPRQEQKQPDIHKINGTSLRANVIDRHLLVKGMPMPLRTGCFVPQVLMQNGPVSTCQLYLQYNKLIEKQPCTMHEMDDKTSNLP